MAAVDYELLLYQRLKAILLAHSPLTTEGDAAYIRPGNWVWYDGSKPDPDPFRENYVPTDFPRLALEPSGRAREMWESRQRYGDHNVNATAASLARNKLVTFNFTVRITHKELRLTMNTPVEAEVERAFEGSNPTLAIPGSPQTAGYAWVRGWGPLAFTRTMGVVEGDTSGTSRMMSVATIPVATLFNSADLLT